MKRLFPLLMAGLAAFPLLAQETAGPSEDWTGVNLAITDNQVIPAYAEFAMAGSALAQAGAAFCARPDATSLAAFRNSFHAGMDAWQQVQHIQFGPITYFNWNFRLQYWPDDKGTGPRQLDALIESRNADALGSDNFARESVGVQGFPALERLLFDDESLSAFREDRYRCQVAQAIAANIGEIAVGVHERWVDEFRATIANADERGFFESAQDATIDFLKAQVESVRRIQQQKVEAIIGDAPGKERIRRAESWHSERSLRNLRLNALALTELFQGREGQALHLGNVLLPEDAAGIDEKFAALNATLAALPDAMDAALELENGHARVQAVADNLDALFEALEAALKHTDLYLGFNSLDGD